MLERPSPTDPEVPLSRAAIGMRPLLRAAADLGVDVDETLALLHVDGEIFRRDDGRIEASLSDRIAASLAARCAGAPLGLIAASRVQHGELGVFDYLVASAETVRDAYALATSFYRLLDDASEIVLSEDAKTARIELRGRANARKLPVFAEFVLGSLVRSSWTLTGRELPGSEVRFEHGCTGDRRTYEAFFLGTQVAFGCDRTELVFPRAYLELRLPCANAVTRSSLARCATELLASTPAPPSLLDRVRACVDDALVEGTPEVAAVARRLGTTSRTLQRKLRAERTSFGALVDEARRDLAVHLVSHGEPVAAVASRVGFEDASAFARAFRRWTAMSPTELRASAIHRAGDRPRRSEW
jgi:AraC-like DNA-binding protein